MHERLEDAVAWARDRAGRILFASSCIGGLICASNAISASQHSDEAVTYQIEANNYMQASNEAQAAYNGTGDAQQDHAAPDSNNTQVTKKETGDVRQLQAALDNAQLAYIAQTKVSEANGSRADDTETAWLAGIGWLMLASGSTAVGVRKKFSKAP